jgi:hypothetical protein
MRLGLAILLAAVLTGCAALEEARRVQYQSPSAAPDGLWLPGPNGHLLYVPVFNYPPSATMAPNSQGTFTEPKRH